MTRLWRANVTGALTAQRRGGYHTARRVLIKQAVSQVFSPPFILGIKIALLALLAFVATAWLAFYKALRKQCQCLNAGALCLLTRSTRVCIRC